MTDRRLFLQASAATAAVPFVGLPFGTASAAPAAGPAPIPIHTLVYDPHFAESRDFAEEGRSQGVDVHAIDGDVTRLWTDHLRDLWSREPVAIAGLTGQGALFCLEQLAWGAGLRVVFQADHARSGSGAVEHAVFASTGAGPLAALLEAAGQDYGRAAAAIVSRRPAGARQVLWRSGASFDPAAPEPLVSWVIAPLGAA